MMPPKPPNIEAVPASRPPGAVAKVINLKWIIPLVLLVILAAAYRTQLRERIRNWATMANDTPTTGVVGDMIEKAADPRAALLAAWNSGGIVHREVAIAEVRQLFPAKTALPPAFETVVLSAALDPDQDVRELALGILRARQDPALYALAAEQARDADPEVRLFGLEQLKDAPAAIGGPLAVAGLDDPELSVVGESAKLLENWSGQSFGFKLADAVELPDATTGRMAYAPQGRAKTMAAAQQARSWWQQHQGEFQPVHLSVPAQARQVRLVSAGDFNLRDMEGRPVRLSDFRGKVVLLNFWTTWCTACVGEMPELIALQNNQSNTVAILGVSLDLLPDDDGDNQPDPKKIPGKVARVIKERGLNYPVILDARDEIGGRFNGGELPTTVIIDAQGYVRRRFVGPRNLAVLETMIAEAGRPRP
jgi:thiol-disulfide isomerase/thioredoxin